jgi:hypothetical protein
MYRRRVLRLVTDRHCPKGSIPSFSEWFDWPNYRPPWIQGGPNREGPGTSGTAKSPSDISSLISSRGLGRLNLFIHWACWQLQYRGPLSNCEIGDQNDCTI